jgi:UTP--glucose-1-phosphate uridylyltransferase
MQKIKKAIIAAAGYGTRFLPQSKAMPKEMMPIVDKPIIQYVVEELVEAGITDIIIVTGYHKRAIEDHFDHSFELEQRLESANKHRQLKEVKLIANMANFYYVRQKGPIGNATAILNAKDLIGDEPFILMWGDDFMESKPSRVMQLIKAYQNNPDAAAVISAFKADRPQDYDKYGYISGQELDNGLIKLSGILEKPGYGNTDSKLAVPGGSLWTPMIFPVIQELSKRPDVLSGKRELMYTDALDILIKKGYNCLGVEINNAKFHDCGDKLEYLKTVVQYGMKHPDVGADFSDWIKKINKGI